MACSTFGINQLIQFIEGQLPPSIYQQLNTHVDYCFDCQVLFMSVADSLTSSSCSVNWEGLNEVLNQSFKSDPIKPCKKTLPESVSLQLTIVPAEGFETF